MTDNINTTEHEDREQALRRAMANIASGSPTILMRERMEKASMELSKAIAILELAENSSVGGEVSGFDLDSVLAVVGDLVRQGKDVLDEATSSALAEQLGVSSN